MSNVEPPRPTALQEAVVLVRPHSAKRVDLSPISGSPNQQLVRSGKLAPLGASSPTISSSPDPISPSGQVLVSARESTVSPHEEDFSPQSLTRKASNSSLSRPVGRNPSPHGERLELGFMRRGSQCKIQTRYGQWVNGALDAKELQAKYALAGAVRSDVQHVVKGKNTQLGKEVAIKVFKKSEIQNVESFVKEVNVWKKSKPSNFDTLTQTNLVDLLEVYEGPDEMYLVMEMMNQTLQSLVEEEGRISEKRAAVFFSQVLTALCHLHSSAVNHGFLRPESVMVSTKDGYDRAKISAVSTSKYIDKVSSAEWSAPESIPSEAFRIPKRDYASDMWCAGTVLYYMLVGKNPFYNGEGREALYETIKKGLYDKTDINYTSLSEEAKSLIDCLIVVNPELRKFPSDLQQHPFILKNESKEIVLRTGKEKGALNLEAASSPSSEMSRRVSKVKGIAKLRESQNNMFDVFDDEFPVVPSPNGEAWRRHSVSFDIPNLASPPSTS